MRALPLIIVVGGDDLAVRVCEELCSTRGHDVVLLWDAGDGLAHRAEAIGAAFVCAKPNDYESLRQCDVERAASIMPVSPDDRLNLQVALKARDLNGRIRIVLRQFNQTLGRKIEQNVANCTAISPAAHAAATYAAAALDSTSFYALQFPDVEGELVAFSERLSLQFGIDDMTPAEAERRRNFRIVSVNGHSLYNRDTPLHRRDRVVVCSSVAALRYQRSVDRRSIWRRRLQTTYDEMLRSLSRTEPVLLRILVAGLIVYFASSLYFMAVLHISFLAASYFVAETMTTVGYGDITPTRGGVVAVVFSILLMFAGVAISGVFIATIAAALTRAQQKQLHGLRRIHAQGHVVLCGAGNVGMRVIEFLLRLRHHVVVVEQNPNSVLMELARDRRIDLLTGDATSDEVMEFCDLRNARAFVAITDSDTVNLEAALGARVENSRLPVVMRMGDPEFARSVGRNFALTVTFSTTELTAPTIAGLSRFRGTRGRVTFDDETYSIAERVQRDPGRPPVVPGALPLFVLREGNLTPMSDFAEVRPQDRLLYLIPLSQFREEK
ncbi:MAG: NAD-binding protein [Candidatus Eremiobacteraeota bacterium]|nr:NAD-binding protein [Candidatus Eremiobacteraeota bacterium]